MKFIVIVFAILIIFGMSTADAQNIPNWIKNNAGWWAEGKITEQEYLNAIKYLIDNQIIKTNSTFTNLSKPEKNFDSGVDYLDAIVVEFTRGDLTKTITVDTFGKFDEGLDTTTVNQQSESDNETYFKLESLPSKDKIEFYNVISQFINHKKIPQSINVKISGLLNNGTTLLSSYREHCNIIDYSLYYQDSTLIYQFTKEKQGEIRDYVLFRCGGASVEEVRHFLNEEEKTEGITRFLSDHKKNSQNPNIFSAIPENNDRVNLFVVHLFDGDLEQVYSYNTFKGFSPIFDSDVSFFNSKPQFQLKSLPGLDKNGFYKLLELYVNPGRTPAPFNVSIDAITGDGTILQRWNYAKCDVVDYSVYLEDYKHRYPYSGIKASENIEEVNFECSGVHLQIHNFDKIENVPTHSKSWEHNFVSDSDFRNANFTNNIGMSYQLKFFGGEIEQPHIYQNFPKVEVLSWYNALVPANHPDQYEYGFLLESNPDIEKLEIYQFLSRYINPGKDPEPFSADLSMITSNGTLLFTYKFTKCSAADFNWYLKDSTSYYELSNIPLPAMRERYINYCTGFNVEVPSVITTFQMKE